MSRELQVTHNDQLNKVAVVKRRSCRIITAIESDRALRKVSTKCIKISVLSNQTTPLEVVNNIGHGNTFFLLEYVRNTVYGKRLVLKDAS